MRNSCFVDIRSGAAHHVKPIFLKIELFLLWRINLAYQVRCVLQALSFFVHKNLLGWRPYLATPCTPPPHFVALFLAATVCGEICPAFIRRNSVWAGNQVAALCMWQSQLWRGVAPNQADYPWLCVRARSTNSSPIYNK